MHAVGSHPACRNTFSHNADGVKERLRPFYFILTKARFLQTVLIITCDYSSSLKTYRLGHHDVIPGSHVSSCLGTAGRTLAYGSGHYYRLFHRRCNLRVSPNYFHLKSCSCFRCLTHDVLDILIRCSLRKHARQHYPQGLHSV